MSFPPQTVIPPALPKAFPIPKPPPVANADPKFEWDDERPLVIIYNIKHNI